MKKHTMDKLKIAFDIDDTLIVPSVATGLDRDTPNYETIALLKWFQRQGHDIFLWSGSGVDWAKTWGEKLGLLPFEVREKKAEIVCKSKGLCVGRECVGHDYDIDIAFDDCDVDLAKVNVKVKRLNNSVSREEWNKNK